MFSRRFIVAAIIVVALVAGCSQFGRNPEATLTHTVKSGESIESIAEDYYGDPRRARAILRFNDVDEDEIAPGTTLRLPMTANDMAALDAREKARVPYNEGLELAARGSFLDATTRFRDALRIDDGFADAYYNLGVTYQRMKAYDRAEESLRKAIRLRKKNPDYYNALGTVYFRQEDYRRAAGAFESALKFNPRHLKAQFSLAASYQKLERIDAARKAWQRYLELDSKSEWADRARENLEKYAP